MSSSLSAAAGGAQELEILWGPEGRGQPYLVLGSLSGNAPGFSASGVDVPLTPDPYLGFTLLHANDPPPLDDTFSVLDELGQGSAAFAPLPGDLTPFVGCAFAHACLLVDVEALTVQDVSEAVTLDVLP